MTVGRQPGQPNMNSGNKDTEPNPKDNLYVFVLQSYMKERGVNLEEAVNAFEKEIKASPGSGTEHVEPLRQAVSYIRSQLEKNKNP